MTGDSLLATIGSGFGWIDWGIVAFYFAVTTAVGGVLAGKQATIRDFFLGGRKLPWYAVSGSIIATEISAVTFISVPFVVFRPGGNFTYLQLGVFGSFLARLIVGYVLVPAYYRREIYSPYDYMGHQLGSGARSVSTALFTLGGVLAQSARVYVTAVVVRVILHDELSWLADHTGVSQLAWAVAAIGLVSIAWTLMGGITTVIWTDLMLFGVFLIGAAVAFGALAAELPGGVGQILRVGSQAGKFQFFDFNPDPREAYTFWAAVIATTWFGVGLYGTDQLMAQRMLCCRDTRAARWAIISSSVSMVVTFMVMLVGVGLFAYYRQHPLEGQALAMYRDKGDSIFPIFIMQAIPTGLKGLIIAGVLAAAVSSLDSIMAALSQTVMSAWYLPWRTRRLKKRHGTPGQDRSGAEAEQRRNVLVSRCFVVGWGVVLCAMAILADRISREYGSILDLALAMAGYAGGGLFAGFLLAFLPLGVDARGYCYSAPLSVLTVFALAWHQPWAEVVCWVGGSLLLLAWLWKTHVLPPDPVRSATGRRVPWRHHPLLQTVFLIVGLAVMWAINRYGYWEGPSADDGRSTCVSVAWPWYAPLGCTVAFVWGYLLARPAGGPGKSSQRRSR